MTHRRHQLVIRWHGNFSHLWGFPPARLFHSQFYCRVELRNVATREGSSLERSQSAAASPPSRLMVTSCKPRTTAHLPLKQTCVAIARIMMCTTPERETVCVASNSISVVWCVHVHVLCILQFSECSLSTVSAVVWSCCCWKHISLFCSFTIKGLKCVIISFNV